MVLARDRKDTLGEQEMLRRQCTHAR